MVDLKFGEKKTFELSGGRVVVCGDSDFTNQQNQKVNMPVCVKILGYSEKTTKINMLDAYVFAKAFMENEDLRNSIIDTLVIKGLILKEPIHVDSKISKK